LDPGIRLDVNVREPFVHPAIRNIQVYIKERKKEKCFYSSWPNLVPIVVGEVFMK
jgi:hypothetical protein